MSGERTAWPQDDPGLLPGRVGSPADRDGRGGSLGFVDYSHPVFEVFNAPRSGDVTTARFFRFRPVEPTPEATVVARFDDGNPALIERRVGAGRVLLWASSIDTFWNDLAKKPVYLPFVHRMVQHLADYAPPTPWFLAGQVLNLAEQDVSLGAGGAAAAEYVVMSPTGARLPVAVGERAGFIDLTEQGVYEVHDANAAEERPLILAVNVDLAEGGPVDRRSGRAGQHGDRAGRWRPHGGGRPGARDPGRGSGAAPVGLVVPAGRGGAVLPGRDAGVEPALAHRAEHGVIAPWSSVLTFAFRADGRARR